MARCNREPGIRSGIYLAVSSRALQRVPGVIRLDLPDGDRASGCVLDRDFHSFSGKHCVGEPFLTQFFDALKKLVVVFWVMMR